ncbi:MAG: HAD family hydrolase [Actinomycetota bacterium]
MADGVRAELTESSLTGAFFDADNTILRGASIFYFARELYRRNFFAAADLWWMARRQVRYRAFGENLDDVHDIRDRALSFVRGHSVAEITAIGEHVYDEVISGKIWPGTLALAHEHLNAGEQVWLVSATPIEMAETIARRLGLTGALGTVAEQRDGIYTGRLVGEPLHGAVKAAAVAELATHHGLALPRCSAYSDSAHDIPLLELVGQPCAVNPDARLRAYARANGWQIRDYRTGRKAAKVGVPVIAGTGAAIGGAIVGAALRRRHR